MYMAPEQAMGQEIGPWTDLYSIGCMAYEFFAGPRAVRRRGADGDPARHINEQPPPLASLRPTSTRRSRRGSRELLVKDVRAAPASANDAWTRFEEILLGTLGPRWRREARLQGVTGSSAEVGAAADAGAVQARAGGPAERLPVRQLRLEQPARAERPGPGDAAAPRRAARAARDRPDRRAGRAADARADRDRRAERTRSKPSTRRRRRDRPNETSRHRSGSTYRRTSRPPTTLRPSARNAEPEPEPVPPEPADTMLRGGRRTGARAAPRARKRRTGHRGRGHRGRRRRSPPRSPSRPPAPRAARPHRHPVRLAAGHDHVRRTGAHHDRERLEADRRAARHRGPRARRAGGAAPGGDPDRGAVLVGTADESANRADLLPPAFVESLGLRDDVTPERTEVMLGDDVPAYRYADLRPLGFGRFMTLYVAPTTAGVATIACVRPGRDRRGRLRRTLRRGRRDPRRSAGAQRFALGPDADYGAAVDAAFATLGGALSATGAVRSARTPGARPTPRPRSRTTTAAAADRWATSRRQPGRRASHARLVGAFGDASDA